jgi:uncharacterized protein
MRKSLDYHDIPRRPPSEEKSPSGELKRRRFDVIDRAVAKVRAEIDLAALKEEEYPKLRKEMEDDKKILAMRDKVAKSLREGLSGFIGVSNTKELQKAAAEKIGDTYQELLQTVENLLPAEFTPYDFLDEHASLPNYSHLSDEEQRKMFGVERNHGWIQSFTGKKLFPLDPRDEDICIRDIAHSLSNVCRFAGHVPQHYSVAQHSVLVSYLSGPFAEHGLLHDASEFALGDVVKPIKKLDAFAGYREAEARMQQLIYRKFGLDPIEPEEVKEADIRIFATEARDLRSITHPDWISPCQPFPFTIVPLPPKEAEALFLARFKELMLKRHNGEEQYQRYMAE